MRICVICGQKIFVIFSVFWIVASITLQGEPLDDPNPVISSERIASIFHYNGVLQAESRMGDGKELQQLIFSAEDNSFPRVYVSVGNPGTFLTPQILAEIPKYTDHPEALEVVTMNDGTKAYIVALDGSVYLTSKDGRFDMKLAIVPPGENIDLVTNDKNKQMLGDGSDSYNHVIRLEALNGIYSTVATNFDQLKKDYQSVITYRRAMMSGVPSAQASSNQVRPETAAPIQTNKPIIPSTAVTPPSFDLWLWLFGGFLILIVVVGLVILFRK